MVETVGDTTTLDPVIPPGLQVYPLAPVAVSVADVPIQMEGLDAVGLTVGLGSTINVRVLVLVQPKMVSPVSVY